MALDNPVQAFLQLAQLKNQNRQQAQQNAMGIGQGLGEGMDAIGKHVQAVKQQQLMDQLVMAMKTQGAPQQGPLMPPIGAKEGPGLQGYVPPGAGPSAVPIGQQPQPRGLPQDNAKTIQALMMQLNPELGMKSLYDQTDPYKQALTAQANAEAQAKLRPPKPQTVYKPYGESPAGTGLILDEASGKVTDTGTKVKPKGSETGDFKKVLEQDRLEQGAMGRVASMRGDASLARTETQRDAAIQAYNTIEEIKKQNRMPSQIEYFDILGQMWKARTGASPTDQAIRDLDAKTLKGDLGKAVQYFTGKPAGRTTAEVLSNIQNFAKSTGEQADKLHEGYMKSHLIKPYGLDDDRWQRIVSAGRGTAFSDAIKKQDDQEEQQQVINGKTYIKKGDQWFEK